MIRLVSREEASVMDREFCGIARKVIRASRMTIGKKHIQHGNTSVFLHSMAVAYYCEKAARISGIRYNRRELIRGALLHDYFLYDWHDGSPDEKTAVSGSHGFHHPQTALINAMRDFDLSENEKRIILCHMFPLTVTSLPRSRESALVCIIDKLCSVYEVFCRNTYKRLKLLPLF